MSLPLLIGLTGQVGSGKSTVAQYLVKRYGYTEFTFAGHLKRSLAFIFGVDEALFHDPQLKELRCAQLFGKSPREVMQSFGTDWGREMVDPLIWSRLVERQLDAHLSQYGKQAVVSDVRFVDEAYLIKQYSGQVWQIRRPGKQYSGQVWQIHRPGNPLTVPGHASENGVQAGLVDRSIINDYTLEKLYSTIDNIAIATHNSDMTTT